MFDMSGKVAIVTGATQGLGAAIARELAARHAAGLVITGRNMERGEAVAGRITAETGVRTEFVQADSTPRRNCSTGFLRSTCAAPSS